LQAITVLQIVWLKHRVVFSVVTKVALPFPLLSSSVKKSNSVAGKNCSAGPSAKCDGGEVGYGNKWICMLLGFIQDLSEEIYTDRREGEADVTVSVF
jgi:hypothetical protein